MNQRAGVAVVDPDLWYYYSRRDVVQDKQTVQIARMQKAERKDEMEAVGDK